MTQDEKKFMAFLGLIQWTEAIIQQSLNVAAANESMIKNLRNPATSQSHILNSHSQDHFFVIAANKLLEYRKWVLELGLCVGVDFNEIDSFAETHIRDLRNMREHVIDYFEDDGHAEDRWIIETPEYSADASSIVGTIIGGRLDWVKFTDAAKRLLPQLLGLPLPYPAKV